MEFRNLIVALAGKESETRLITTAVRLAARLQGTLTVLHVKHPGAGKPHMLMDAPDSAGEKELRGLVREAGHPDQADTIPVRIVEGDAYHERIVEATESADLMIVGHSRRNAFINALADSVDEKVANVARCPVLVVPRG